MRHLSEQDLILLYYSEPDAPPDAREHLAACRDCAAQAVSLAATLDQFVNWPEGEPGFEPDATFDNRLWRDIAARLSQKRENGRPMRLFALAAAFATLVIAAFIAGRLSTQTVPPVTAGLSRDARQRVLEISLADHLDRAEILLTNLSNGIPPDRGRAADLVSEGRLLRGALARSDEPGALGLVDDVERLLMETANEPEHPSVSEIAALQRRIEEDSLVFKIRIIKSNLRIRGQRS